MAPKISTPPYFLTTGAISFLLVTGINILVPALPLYAATYGVSATQIGLVIGAFAIGRLLFEVVGGALGDAFGFRVVAVAGCAITAAASVVAGLTSSYGVLLAARTAQGAGSALYTTSAIAFVLALAPAGATGRLAALYQGTLSLGLAIGPAIGGVVASVFGLRGPFFAYAVMAFLGLAFAVLRLPSSGPSGGRTRHGEPGGAGDGQRSTRRTAVWRIVRTRAFALCLLVAAVVFWSRSGVRNALLPLYAAGGLGLDEAAVGGLLTVVAIGNIAVVGHAGRLLDRRGRRPVLVAGLTVTAASVALFAATREPWSLFGVALVFGVVTGYIVVAPAVVVADVAEPRVRGTAVGVQRMAIDIGLLAGPISAGALVDAFTFHAAFLAIALLVALTAVAALAMPETKRAPDSP